MKKDKILTEIGEGILLGTCNNLYESRLINGAMLNLGYINSHEYRNNDYSDLWDAWEDDLATKLEELEIEECTQCGWWCNDVFGEGDSGAICHDCEEENEEDE